MNASAANPADISLGWAARPGPGRAVSQDSLGLPDGIPEDLLASKGWLYLVADGIGGHQAGEVASHLAVSIIRRAYYEDPDPDIEASLRRAIVEANAEILRQAQDPAHAGMGTTVVAAVVRGEEMMVAHVGDSRAYLWRGGRLHPLTADHTWVAERLAAGILTPEEAANHPMRHVLTRSLGSAPDVEADAAHYSLLPGDRLLLCTDGVWEVLSEEEMARILGRADPQRAATALVNRALESGGQDDATALVVERSAPRSRQLARAFSGLPLWAWAFLGLAALLVLALLCATPVLISATRHWSTPGVTPTPTAQTALNIVAGPTSTPTPSPTPSPSPLPSPTPTPAETATPIPTGTLPPQEYAFSNPRCVGGQTRNPNRGKELYLRRGDQSSGLCLLPPGERLDVVDSCDWPDWWGYRWCEVRIPSARLLQLCPANCSYYPSSSGWSYGYIPEFRLIPCP